MHEWLAWIGSLNAKQIDLSLDRVKTLVTRLGIVPTCKVITVGGTNGKGSTVAALESIYLAGGYHTGAFTSPFLFSYNEQVRLDGVNASDDLFCTAFEQIETVRGDISLTPFEFHTLAAFLIFQSRDLDVWILEVGLGGRLDAVNVLDADVAIVTSISIDHVEWLGDSRESIGFEKAGIFRNDRPAICGDSEPPNSLLNYAREIGANLWVQGKDFTFLEMDDHWDWTGNNITHSNLPKPTLALQNMSTALMGIQILHSFLPITRQAIDGGLSKVRVPGRIEIFPGAITEIYDVSHNPASVALLADKLKRMKIKGNVRAVFSMLADKDIELCVSLISNLVQSWYVAELQTPRAMPISKIVAVIEKYQQLVDVHSNMKSALTKARIDSKAHDVIIIFGSFHTISEVR